jgi:hypothetical protein
VGLQAEKNLVIAFLHAECAPCSEFLVRLAAQSITWGEQNTVALVSFLDSQLGRIANDLPGEIVVGADVSGNAAVQYLGADAAFSSTSAPAGVFVADRYEELYAQWQVRMDHSFPAAQIVSWPEHIELAC